MEKHENGKEGQKKVSLAPSPVGIYIATKRNLLGLSQTAIARLVGIAPASISQLENGGIQYPGSDILYKLSKVFNCSMEDMMLGTKLGLSNNVTRDLSISFPLMTWSEINNELKLSASQYVGRKFYTSNVHCSTDSFGIEVTDDSMEPDFSKGDILIIDPNAQPSPKSYVLIKPNNNKAMLKKVIYSPKGMYFISLNEKVDNTLIPFDASVKVYGVVMSGGFE